MIAEKRKLFFFFSIYWLLVYNWKQTLSMTYSRQDLSVAVHTDNAVDMHACNDHVSPQ